MVDFEVLSTINNEYTAVKNSAMSVASAAGAMHADAVGADTTHAGTANAVAKHAEAAGAEALHAEAAGAEALHADAANAVIVIATHADVAAASLAVDAVACVQISGDEHGVGVGLVAAEARLATGVARSVGLTNDDAGPVCHL